jgi:GT2 family glycosyltransferase
MLVANMSDTKDSASSIAVVICTHNRPALLERCLKRLRQNEGPAYSVVVVDSAPNSSKAKSVAARYGAQYHLSPVKGLSRARNIGTRATQTDIIAYLDDDMVPHARWLASLIAEFADNTVAAVTGPVLALELGNGTDVDLQLAVGLVSWGPNRFQIDQRCRQWFERTNFGGIGDGNFALRRSSFELMRGFDERLGRGATIDSGEEHYAYFKLVERGFKITYTPRAIVFHPNSQMSRIVLRKRRAETVAFGAFLAWNHPVQSWRVAKFFIEGMFSTRRWWRAAPESEILSMPVREKIASGISGIFIFCHSLRKAPK